MKCAKCGTRNSVQSSFCSQCGAVLQRASGRGASEVLGARDESPEEYLEAAIGYRNSEYYLRKFRAFRNDEGWVSWNWPAFFFSLFWLLYRKMWAYAGIYFVSQYVLAGVTLLFISHYWLWGSLWLIYYVTILITFPLYANGLYYWHLQNKIDKLTTNVRDKQRRLRALEREGGTSNIVIILALIFLLAIPFLGILAAIAIPAYNDYLLRSIVSTGIADGQRTQAQVEVFEAAYHRWPKSVAELTAPPQASSANVLSIDVRDGVIEVMFSGKTELEGKRVFLTPTYNSTRQVIWTCDGSELKNRWLPAHCRVAR